MTDSADNRLQARNDLAWAIAIGGIGIVLFAALLLFAWQFAATLFLPRAKKRHAVLINSATAVPRKVYRGFAGYLARRGAAVLTYDYRGTGDSRPMAEIGRASCRERV